MDAWNETFFNGDAQASGYESPDSSQHSVSDLNQPVFDSEPSESEFFEVLGLQVAQSSPQQEVDKVHVQERPLWKVGNFLQSYVDGASGKSETSHRWPVIYIV